MGFRLVTTTPLQADTGWAWKVNEVTKTCVHPRRLASSSNAANSQTRASRY